VLLDVEVYSIGDSLFKVNDICNTLYIVSAGTVQLSITETDSKGEERVVGGVAPAARLVSYIQCLVWTHHHIATSSRPGN
jgi:CRP-like cAMP-binding protein